MKHFTYCEDSGRVALIFDAEFYNHEIIRSALRLPFLTTLLGKPYYAFSADDGRIVVSSWLESVPCFPQALSDNGELVVVNRAITWLSLRTLYAQCYDLAKLGTNCEACRKKGRVCMESLLMKCANEHNLSFTPSPEQPFMGQIDPDDKDDLQKLDRFLRRQSLNGTWAYAPPHLTEDSDLISKKERREILRHPTDHDFTCIEEVREKYSERSLQAAKTRKAVKRCKNECILCPSCDWCTPPYYGAPFHCQDHDNDGYYRGKGPYTLEEIRSRVELPSLSREAISLFAYNGSLVTEIFDHRVHLRRMDLDRGTVEFMPSYTKSRQASMHFSIEDALKLCKIPYRENGEYKKPVFHEPPRLMDDDELRLYALCCEYNETKGHRTMYGYVCPPVLSLEWSPATKSFRIDTPSWPTYTVSDFHDLLSAFGRDVLRYF